MLAKRPRLSLLAIVLSLVFLGFLILSPTGTSLSVEKIGKASSSAAAPTSPDELDPALSVAKDEATEEAEALNAEAEKESAAHYADKPAKDVLKGTHDASKDATKDSKQGSTDKVSAVADVAKGKPIMKKMGNETVKAELGRAAWKVFHTILAQYPDEPGKEEQETLMNYIHLFSRVYPCRECAEHFQILLEENPPQVSSKKIAMLWGCHVHNKVNKRLGKEIFDCAYIGDKYDCGCAEDAEDDDKVEKTVPAVKGG